MVLRELVLQLQKTTGFLLIALFTTIVHSAGMTASSQTHLASSRPNIIVIFADDLGYGDIGSYGSKTIKTPNIDRMAAQGAKFDQFYSASPVCTPSRAALLTGRYPIRQGIHEVFYPESFQGMDPEEVTIAEMLKDVGYVTGLVGKWHLGHHDQYMPWNQGFDEFFGVPYSNDMGGLYYFRDRKVTYKDIDQRYMTRTYTEEALKFIDKHRQQPFFLYLAHNMPHVPLYASPEFEGKSKGGLYGDVVEELDWSVGEVLSKLESLGLAQNTLVIFTSDNGPWLLMGDHGGSAGELRMGKQYTFEGGMRVPTVAYWPGTIAGQTRPAGMATMMDWLPTFARLSGASVPSDRVIDGKDITGLLTGNGEREAQELFYYMKGELRAYRSGEWKLKLPFKGMVGWLSVFNSGLSRGHDMLLFNLKKDPQERNNLAEDNPQRVEQMLAEIREFKASLGVLPEAKVTGKNMDRGPYIQLLISIVIKSVFTFLVLILMLWGVLRWRKSIRRPEKHQSRQSHGETNSMLRGEV
ncbi:sulfatase [Pseudomaricurvus alkylphenolicus]|uniref:sulfatase family protein n=1 Tax=Pseudomaricurvus alkylphenolicus TaxID=1306991 RepID=UPI001422E443|nr:sulfatase [Pseudomaricurvus alkylphenolicus]NIB38598.1 sulfatase [Pseudomaricurvus alkylphenolicus]